MNKISSVKQTALAKQLQVSPQAVWKWLHKGRVPAERVLAVEAATGVSRYELRPDIYGIEPGHQQAA